MLEELCDDRACTSRIESVGGCDTSPCLFQSTIFVVLWTEQRCRPTIYTFVQHLMFQTCDIIEHSSLARLPNLRRQCFCYLLPIYFDLPVRAHPQGKGTWWRDRMDPICRRELVWSGHCLSPYTPLHRNEVSSLLALIMNRFMLLRCSRKLILNVPIADLDSTRITQMW